MNVKSLGVVSFRNEVSQTKAATSIVDPIPTCLYKSCFTSMCPVILNIMNDSLYWCCASSS